MRLTPGGHDQDPVDIGNYDLLPGTGSPDIRSIRTCKDTPSGQNPLYHAALVSIEADMYLIAHGYYICESCFLGFQTAADIT